MFDKILDQGVDGKVTIGNIRSKNSQCVINSKKRHVIIEDNCSFLEGVDKLMTSRHLCAIRLHERKTAMP